MTLATRSWLKCNCLWYSEKKKKKIGSTVISSSLLTITRREKMMKTLPSSLSRVFACTRTSRAHTLSVFSWAPQIQTDQLVWGSVFSFLEKFPGNQEGPFTLHSSKWSEEVLTAVYKAVLGLLPSQVFHFF